MNLTNPEQSAPIYGFVPPYIYLPPTKDFAKFAISALLFAAVACFILSVAEAAASSAESISSIVVSSVFIEIYPSTSL